MTSTSPNIGRFGNGPCNCDRADMAASARIRLAACAKTPLIAVLLAALALSGMFCASSKAYAEVRKADVIAGMTVEQRDAVVAECPSIDAERAVLMGEDGTVYFEREGSAPAQIASITKVMTAIVAIDNCEPNTQVTVSEAAASIGESSANLAEGDVLDFESALKALLVPSGNDAALALAETVGAQMMERDPSLGSDPVVVFVKAMNDKAAEIGCEDTFYENPHGLDDGVYEGNLHSTALDQAKVAQCAMTYDTIRDIVSGGSTSITVKREGEKVEVELETTDLLLDMYREAIGIKTGVTDLAGPSFMGAAVRDGRELYAIVLDSADEYQRFEDAKSLFLWAYDHVHEVALANTDEEASMEIDGEARDVPVVAEAPIADWIDKTVKVTYADPDAAVTVFDLEGNVSQSFSFDELYGTVSCGDKVGTAVFKQRNMVVAEQDLIACETVEGPNPIDAIGVWWQRVLSGFDGSPTQAQSVVYNVMPILSNNVSNAA